MIFHCVNWLPYKLYKHYDNESYPVGSNINITGNKAVTAALQTSEMKEILVTGPCILKYRSEKKPLLTEWARRLRI
jgi:hypothetical protein